ncbi:polysaccharide biosynthesis protein [Pacificibacter marinus]|uniref:UDP-N-acetyl-alpha-D-glucosamine C6 dehydratase n=1 Tax=Pacificibacter marinus TaxID=658057 RepID=A0A1Y5S2H4_9RHOB|nr:nucleoside-diphosphate sugar epimerase/dehydratase [Pacificibacter marinus]SEK92591.1 NDP-sugar epimerase, includes UDP-GlcNAc-inverting 4,6-dehydratase FlaA1 and capsular polysaccharide biosynthesis protein EpsC [Pacificibacter marinus]SLN31160.1 UDP-N-acetyl-alpha-D-glucosamine C6 dehydratase [Pacificibacter marinus]
MLTQGLTTLPRGYVRSILIVSDTILMISALFVAFKLHGDLGVFLTLPIAVVLVPSMVVFGTVILMFFKLHRIKLVMFNSRDVSKIALASFCLGCLFSVTTAFLGVAGFLAKAIIFGGVFFCGSVWLRATAIAVLSKIRDRIQLRQPVAIFGAGAAGIQLASALRQSHEMRPVFFLDDNLHLRGMAIGGIPVLDSKTIVENLAYHKIEVVLVALPESAKARRAAIIEQLKGLGVEVRVLPSFEDLLVGRGDKALFRTVSPDEILGRDAVDLETPEIAQSYAGRVVMVTGAGGSIGSELCRQILECKPTKIVLLDQSEFNLYQIDLELKSLAEQRNVQVKSFLGSVTDSVRVRKILNEQNVDIIFHAAAYKHVPIVEGNELEGARNNVLGTKIVADAAADAKIERFILVSTDKAVRPTNIMGATKRMAELVVQDIQSRKPDTVFSMVRFGNVLGSSGSVLPLFQKQIDAGGPVTVTHPEVSRFFMTISEATRLVLLAGAYAQGGDVFVLDMGQPQKIMEIAHRLIELSGRTVKTACFEDGDIEIIVTGLRPGEKLYEELLLDHGNLCATANSKIMRAEEAMLSEVEVAGMLRDLRIAVSTANAAYVRKVVRERVDGYHDPRISNDMMMREVAT